MICQSDDTNAQVGGGQSRIYAAEKQSVIRTAAARVHRAPAFLVRKARGNIVILFVKLMEHQVFNGKRKGVFGCLPVLALGLKLTAIWRRNHGKRGGREGEKDSFFSLLKIVHAVCQCIFSDILPMYIHKKKRMHLPLIVKCI